MANNLKKQYFYIAALLLCIFFKQNVISQNVDVFKKRKHNIYLTLRPLFYTKPTISFNQELDPNKGGLKHQFNRYFDFNLMYRYNINKHFSLITGLRFERRRLYAEVYAGNEIIQKYMPSNIDWGNTYDGFVSKHLLNMYFSFPITFQYRFPVKNNHFLSFKSSVIFNLISSWESGYTVYYGDGNINGNEFKAYDQSIFTNINNNKPHIDLEFGFVYEWALPKRDFLQFGPFVRFPTYKKENFYSGNTFTFFPNTPDEVTGTITPSNIAYGLELNYIFSFHRKERKLNNQSKKLHINEDSIY